MVNAHMFYAIAVMTLITALLRFLPFLIFKGKAGTPPMVEKLGLLLPSAVIAMLVVYCMKDVSVMSAPYGIPELISCAAVAGLHIWKRNSLLSIGAGTVCYMLLVQLVF